MTRTVAEWAWNAHWCRWWEKLCFGFSHCSYLYSTYTISTNINFFLLPYLQMTPSQTFACVFESFMPLFCSFSFLFSPNSQTIATSLLFSMFPPFTRNFMLHTSKSILIQRSMRVLFCVGVWGVWTQRLRRILSIFWSISKFFLICLKIYSIQYFKFKIQIWIFTLFT